MLDHVLEGRAHVDPTVFAGAVPHNDVFVVPRPRSQQHLGVLGVAVRAVLDRGLAEGLEVEI